VPEAHTDYIISVISEEFGVVAIILILLLFLIFIYMVFKKISFENNDKIKLILIGSISLILMQTTIHVGVNIRLFPTTGMTLPFLSYGGSSIVSTSILAGIILNLTKRKIS
jgi:cell division protein FtsW